MITGSTGRRAGVEGNPGAAVHGVRMAEMMNCDELVERVTDYFEDALAPEDHARLQEHITFCVGCVAHLDEVRVMLRLVSTLPEAPLAADLESRLLAAHRRWAGSVSS